MRALAEVLHVRAHCVVLVDGIQIISRASLQPSLPTFRLFTFPSFTGTIVVLLDQSNISKRLRCGTDRTTTIAAPAVSLMERRAAADMSAAC
jgi:hypothetical protein